MEIPVQLAAASEAPPVVLGAERFAAVFLGQALFTSRR